MSKLMTKLAIQGGDPIRREPLHFHRALLGPEETAAVTAVLSSGWLTTGPRAAEFETRLAERVGGTYAVAMNSCTAALHIALLALDIGPGDEVVTTPLTFAATGNVIVHAGATPVFADVDPDTLNMDPGALEDAITERTKAVIVVHFAGHPVDLDAVERITGRHDIPVIVDAAHAIETGYRGRPSGTHGLISCYSFYATKNLTTGEGGMLVTERKDLADRARVLRLHGMSRDAYKRYAPGAFVPYEVEAAGWKYNLTDMQAALGLCQLDRLDSMHARRREIAERYDRAFARTPAVKCLTLEDYATPSAYHLYVVQFDIDSLQATRNQIAAALVAEGIGVGVHFEALHLQPYYTSKFEFAPGLCQVAERAGERVLSLPLYPAMSDADVEDVIAAVLKVVVGLESAT